MAVVSTDTYSLEDTKTKGLGFKCPTSGRGRNPVFPLEVHGTINKDLVALYELVKTGENGDQPNENLQYLGLVDEEGNPTPRGTGIIDYLLVTNDERIGYIQRKFQEFDVLAARRAADVTEDAGCVQEKIPVNMDELSEHTILKQIHDFYNQNTLYGREPNKEKKLHSLGLLAAGIVGKKWASDTDIKETREIIYRLKDSGLVEATKERIYTRGGESFRPVYRLTQLGEEVLLNGEYKSALIPGKDTIDESEEPQIPPETGDNNVTEPAQHDDRGDVYTGILEQFNEFPSADKSTQINDGALRYVRVGNERYPLMSTGLDQKDVSRFKDAVYVMINEEPLCVGYIAHSGNLVPSIEAMYALLIRRNSAEGKISKKAPKITKNTIISFFEELEGPLNTWMSQLMDDNVAGTAFELKARSYRNTSSFVSNSFKLKEDTGVPFVNVLMQLFNKKKKNFSVANSKGDAQEVSGAWLNAEKYLHTRTVQPRKRKHDENDYVWGVPHGGRGSKKRHNVKKFKRQHYQNRRN